MKKTLIAAVLALAVPVAFASGWNQGPGGGPRGPNLDRMTIILDLTAEQRTGLEKIYAEQKKTRQTMREQMRADMKGRMAEVLTPEQMAKMEALREMRGQHRGKGRCGKGSGMGRGGMAQVQ